MVRREGLGENACPPKLDPSSLVVSCAGVGDSVSGSCGGRACDWGACSPTPRHPTDISVEGLPARVSQPVEFALAPTVGPRGTLVSARLVDPSPGLHVVSVGLAQSGDVANGEPYPPRHAVTPLPANYQGPTLVAIAIEADHPGTYDGLGVVLTWKRNGKTYSAYQAIGVRLCVGSTTCQSSDDLTRKISQLDLNKVPL